jgi:hypothetical protein
MCVGLLDLPDELFAITVAHLPEDDEFAAALACARLRKAVASSARPSTSPARTSTSIGSVFRSLAKLQWAISCGLPIDSELARKAKYGPREHLLLLLDTLPGLPLIGLRIHSTKLDLCDKQIGDTGALGLAKALEVNKTLTNINLLRNAFSIEAAALLVQATKSNGCQLKSLCGIWAGAASADFVFGCLSDSDAILLAYDLEVNAMLTELDLDSNQIGDAGAIGLGKALKVKQEADQHQPAAQRLQHRGGRRARAGGQVQRLPTQVTVRHQGRRHFGKIF